MKIFYLESNPLDEFSVNFYSYTVILNYSFHMNSIYIQLGYIYSLIFCFYVGEFLFKPDIFQYPFELIYKFVFNFFKENSFSMRSSKYFILYLTIFVIILVSNLTGLVHYHKSIMAQFLITFFLAMLVFVFLILVGFILYKIYFYKIIEPENIPKSLFLMNFFFILFLSLNLVGKVNIFKKFIINLCKPFLFNRDLLFFTLLLTLFFFFNKLFLLDIIFNLNLYNFIFNLNLYIDMQIKDFFLYCWKKIIRPAWLLYYTKIIQEPSGFLGDTRLRRVKRSLNELVAITVIIYCILIIIIVIIDFWVIKPLKVFINGPEVEPPIKTKNIIKLRYRVFQVFGETIQEDPVEYPRTVFADSKEVSDVHPQPYKKGEFDKPTDAEIYLKEWRKEQRRKLWKERKEKFLSFISFSNNNSKKNNKNLKGSSSSLLPFDNEQQKKEEEEIKNLKGSSSSLLPFDNEQQKKEEEEIKNNFNNK